MLAIVRFDILLSRIVTMCEACRVYFMDDYL